MRSTAARLCMALIWLATITRGELAVAQPSDETLRAFRAVYGLFDGDKRVGQAEFTLRYDAISAHYVYESRSEFDAFLLRLAAPRPVIERSEFRIERGTVRPLSYLYQDGTRRGRRNLSLDFRWREKLLAVTHPDDTAELPLPAQALDRASVKMALGLAVRDGQRGGRHDVADPDEFHTYEFANEGAERVRTPVGELDVHRIKQWRAESSREMILWIAPALDFNAVRIEQRRPDRDPVAFVLETFDWLAADGATARATPQ